MVSATRTNEDSEVLLGMKRIWISSESLKNVVTDRKLLYDHAHDQRLPEQMRAVFQNAVDTWDNEKIPSVIRFFNAMPDVPARARQLMFSAEEYISMAQKELAESDMRIAMLEKASKDPRLKGSGELAIVSRLETALREKAEQELEATRRLIQIADEDIVMALVKYTAVNAKEEMRTMTAVRRDHEIQEPVLSTLRTIENNFVAAWSTVATGASTDSRFPRSCQAWMQQSATEAKQYRWDSGKPENLDKITIDFGSPETPQEMIENQKEAVKSLEDEALDPKTPKTKRGDIVMWIEGLKGRIFAEQAELEEATERIQQRETQAPSPQGALRKGEGEGSSWSK